MKYRNTKTGAIIEVRSILRGNWERIDSEQAEKPAVAEAPVAEEPKKATIKKPIVRKTKK